MVTALRRLCREHQHVAWLAFLTAVVSFGWFLVDGHVKLALADEGFLWYGMEALRHGQVPMRDFEAYDPGRYAWTAAWSYLLGDGVVAMRLSCVIFQCFGILAGLLAARRLSRNWVFLIGIGILLCAWMHPRYKVFEQSIALMALYAGVLLIESPSLRRHWWVGIFGGISAIFGRNHGAYHVFAFGLLITWTAWGNGWKCWLQRCFVWGCGLLVGYLPQWLMFLFVPGFFEAYLPYIAGIGKTGTNLAAPVPWPWLIPAHFPPWYRIAGRVEGCFYIILPLFFAGAAIRAGIAWARKAGNLQPFLVAAVCVSIPYTHFVFSRPDIVHLAHGAPTALLGVLALIFSLGPVWSRWAYGILPVLAAASLISTSTQCGVTLTLLSDPDTLYEVPVRQERMIVSRYYAHVLASAHQVATLAKPDEPILFLPLMPGLYPFTGRLSPTKQIYFVFPPDDAKLLAEIQKAGVQWVMYQEYALDGREDLRFRNTCPQVVAYFKRDFERVAIPTLPPDTIVMHRRANLDTAPPNNPAKVAQF